MQTDKTSQTQMVEGKTNKSSSEIKNPPIQKSASQNNNDSKSPQNGSSQSPYQSNKKPHPVLTKPKSKTNNLNKSAPPQVLQYSKKQSGTSPKTERCCNPPDYSQAKSWISEKPDVTTKETDELKQIYLQLRDYARKCGDDGNYDEAEEVANQSEVVKTELTKRQPNTNKTDELEEVQQKRESEFELQWKEKFDQFDNITKEKQNQIQAEHEKQMAEFEDYWANSMPMKYRKPSPSLLQLKHIEKSLANTGQYARAKEVRAEVDAQALKEMEIAQNALIKDYNAAKRQKLFKHNKEMENFQRMRLHNRDLLFAQYISEKAAIDHRSEVIQIRSKETRLGKRGVSADDSASCSITEKNDEMDVLLPPLKPPNDPSLMEAHRQKQREIAQRQKTYQKQNAEDALAKYSTGSLYHRTTRTPMHSNPNRSNSHQNTSRGSSNESQSRTSKNEENQLASTEVQTELDYSESDNEDISSSMISTNIKNITVLIN